MSFQASCLPWLTTILTIVWPNLIAGKWFSWLYHIYLSHSRQASKIVQMQVQKTAKSLSEIQNAHSVFLSAASGLCMISNDGSWRVIYGVLRKLIDLSLQFQDLANSMKVWGFCTLQPSSSHLQTIKYYKTFIEYHVRKKTTYNNCGCRTQSWVLLRTALSIDKVIWSGHIV